MRCSMKDPKSRRVTRASLVGESSRSTRGGWQACRVGVEWIACDAVGR